MWIEAYFAVVLYSNVWEDLTNLAELPVFNASHIVAISFLNRMVLCIVVQFPQIEIVLAESLNLVPRFKSPSEIRVLQSFPWK